MDTSQGVTVPPKGAFQESVQHKKVTRGRVYIVMDADEFNQVTYGLEGMPKVENGDTIVCLGKDKGWGNHPSFLIVKKHDESTPSQLKITTSWKCEGNVARYGLESVNCMPMSENELAIQEKLAANAREMFSPNVPPHIQRATLNNMAKRLS